MALFTFAEYARHRKVSRAAVTFAVQAGRITTIAGSDGKPKIDPAMADIEWLENTDPMKRREKKTENEERLNRAAHDVAKDIRKSSSIPHLAESRAIKEAIMVRLADLTLKERQGLLVDISIVKDEAFKLARTTRDAMLNIADRIAAQLAAESDPHRVHMVLTEEIQKALEELSKNAQ